MSNQATSVIRNTANMRYLSDVILVRKIHPNAVLPVPAHEDDVGFDIYPVENVTLLAGRTTVVPTGIIMAGPPGWLMLDDKIRATFFMKIEGRSGLAVQGVFPVGGILDPCYRGEIKAILYNSTEKDIILPTGRAMAQLIVYHTESPVFPYKVLRFLSVDESSSTDRDADGFGSTDSR